MVDGRDGITTAPPTAVASAGATGRSGRWTVAGLAIGHHPRTAGPPTGAVAGGHAGQRAHLAEVAATAVAAGPQ